MKSLLSPVLIIIVALIGYYYALPLYDQVTLLQEKLNESESLLTSMQNMEVRLAELESEYKSFSDYERGVLTRLIPRTVTEADLLHDFTAIAERNNLSIGNVAFAGDGNETVEQALGSGDVLEGDPGEFYKRWSVIIGVTGSYENFKSFLEDLAGSIRITDIMRVTIGATQEQNLSSFEVEAFVYSIE